MIFFVFPKIICNFALALKQGYLQPHGWHDGRTVMLNPLSLELSSLRSRRTKQELWNKTEKK